jgi:bacteriorhodopsin
MLRLFKPIVLPAAIGLCLLVVARFLVTQQLYRWILFGASVAFLAIAVWVVTSMVTGYNVPGR